MVFVVQMLAVQFEQVLPQVEATLAAQTPSQALLQQNGSTAQICCAQGSELPFRGRRGLAFVPSHF